MSSVKAYEQSSSLDFSFDDIKAVGLDKLDNILQTDNDKEKEVSVKVKVRGKRSYDNNKKYTRK